MAHQYSAAPPYGAQYSTTPYYSPFTPPIVQQIGNGIPGLQQTNVQSSNLQTPVNPPNSLRYDANAHIHPQIAPLPFAPPHFDPALLKHFPPPPPLPLPGSHFGAASNSVPAFPPFPQVANLSPHSTAPHNFLHLAQQSTPSNAISIPNQPATPTNDPRLHRSPLAMHSLGGTTDQLQNRQSPAQGAQHDHTIGPSSRRSFDMIENGLETHRRQSGSTVKDNEVGRSAGRASDQDVQQHIPPPTVVTQRPDRHSPKNGGNTQTHPSPDLKERAKAALLSLIPHNIQYNDFRAEGVNSQVLQQLYEEIGLNWQTPMEPGQTNVGATPTSKQKRSTIAESSNSTSLDSSSVSAVAESFFAKASPVTTSPVTVPPAPNQSMARKDRIAQLLAAKAGKVTGPGHTSKSHSPASAIESAQIQVPDTESTISAQITQPSKPSRVAAQTDMVRQKMELLRKETATQTKAEQGQPTLHTQAFGTQAGIAEMFDLQDRQVSTLPTPIREHLVQNGLSSLIPGLFLRSAEPEDDPVPMPLDPVQSASAEQIFMPITTTQASQPPAASRTSSVQPTINSRKRSIDEIIGETAESHQSPKRQVLQADGILDEPIVGNDDVEDEDASEGEIVEEEPVTQNAQVSSVGSAVSFPQAELGQQNYVSKPSEIELMRKRITEMEQRHGLKRGQSFAQSPTGSNTSVPTVPSAPANTTSSPLSKAPEQAFPSAKLDDRPGHSPRSLVKATPEQIAERAAQLKADFLRSRALRQKQLQEGIPALENEVAKTRHKLKVAKDKLSETVADILQQYTAIDRTRLKERELEEEIANLEKQLSDGVSGQKQYSNELNHLKQGVSKNAAIQPLPSLSLAINQSHHQPDQDRISKNLPAHTLETETVREHLESDYRSSGQDAPSTSQHNQDAFLASQQQSMGSAVDAQVEERVNTGDVMEPKASQTASNDYDSPASTSLIPPRNEVRSEHHMEDSDEPMDESDEESEDSHMSIDEETDDSVSMSDSGSDDYEPAEPEESPQSDDKMESDEYEPNIENSPQSHGATEEEGEAEEREGDDYEPAETLSPVDTNGHSSSHGSAQTPSWPVDAYSELHDVNGVVQEEPLVVSAVPATADRTGVDDQEKGLQLSEADTLTKPQISSFDENVEGSTVLGTSEPLLGRYVPYQSPLASLKSYRFHPSFKEQVGDGYRSLTYSHKIDSKSPVCLTELGGSPCTDPECQDQHFGSMALPDDKILVQMSSASNIKDKKLRDQFLVGLKQMIARLRQEGVKDFTAVADALSQYRREWGTAQAGS